MYQENICSSYRLSPIQLGEENAAHQNLDNLLEPREKDCQTQSAIMDWDNEDDRSLMEWQEEEEPDRIRKRKRKSNKRSRRQYGVTPPNNITNIPRERENSKRRVGEN